MKPKPSPLAFREAVRDVIRHCIYGVDLNPLAVELCKVALWLEAHVPGESLNFLDHHIKCGNAIVGLAHEAELQRGIPEEAFNRLPDDDKDIASEFRKRNKDEKKEAGQQKLNLAQTLRQELQPVSREYAQLAALPDHDPADYEKKKKQFEDLGQRKDLWRLRTLANLQVAQFFIPKTPENKSFLCTEEEYRDYLTGKRHPQSQAVARANSLAVQKHWFHWFIEFPDIFENGGFDCILGNPPYLGGQALSGTYGHPFCTWVKYEYAPAGSSDLVVYFLRRIYDLIGNNRFLAIITTNSIKDGDVRKDGLEVVLSQGGNINFAIRGTKWPGHASLFVSLLSLHKGTWKQSRELDGRSVSIISPFLEDTADDTTPDVLASNSDKVFQGSILLGDGFLLSPTEADRLIAAESRNREVIFPVINGEELNNEPDQTPKRRAINFFDWSEKRAMEYAALYEIVKNTVYPVRQQQKRETRKRNWWHYAEKSVGLYNGIKQLQRCFVTAATTKHLNFSASPTNRVFTHALYALTSDRFSDYCLVQSTIHETWARKYCGALETRLRYSPSDCFETFPFPPSQNSAVESELEQIGERYHEHRRELMLKLQLGLTKTYNLFHDRELSVELVAKESKQPVPVAESAHADLLQLRALHMQMDQTVLAAYGWHQPSDVGPAIALRHDFYEVDYLPENDRVRYTIHPDARKEILKRLLQLNHQLYAEEEAKGLHKPKKAGKKAKGVGAEEQNQPTLGIE